MARQARSGISAQRVQRSPVASIRVLVAESISSASSWARANKRTRNDSSGSTIRPKARASRPAAAGGRVQRTHVALDRAIRGLPRGRPLGG